MSDQTAPSTTFATQEQIAATVTGNPITSAMVDAYLEVTETDDITHSGLAFAVAVDDLIGIKFQDDPEAVISDLRWIAEMANAAANDLEEKNQSI
jgi:hypothetical protein